MKSAATRPGPGRKYSAASVSVVPTNQINNPLTMVDTVTTIAMRPGRMPATTTVKNHSGDARRKPSIAFPGAGASKVANQCQAQTMAPHPLTISQSSVSNVESSGRSTTES